MIKGLTVLAEEKMKFERIKKLRKDKNLTQKTVAEYLGISQSAYSHYENGERRVPTYVLIDLAEYYNTSIDYIMSLSDVNKPYPKPKNK